MKNLRQSQRSNTVRVELLILYTFEYLSALAGLSSVTTKFSDQCPARATAGEAPGEVRVQAAKPHELE